MLKEQFSRLRRPGRRAILIGLVVLIVVLGLGGGLWLALQPRHVTTLPNQGNSLLSISASGQGSGYEDTLTMIRTSDGKLLWRYQVPGTLARNSDAIIRAGRAVQIVNGAIYFLVDTNPQSPPANPQSQLMALRASNGGLLWKQQIQNNISAYLMSVSDGVACVQTELSSGYITINSFMVQCYQADTGAPAWHRQLSDIDKHAEPNFFSLDGLLYFVATIPGVSGKPDHSRYVAVQMNDGKTRWSYDDRQVDSAFGDFPLLSDHGIAVFLLAPIGILTNPGSTPEMLAGLDEGSGKLLWRYQVPGYLTNRFSHQELAISAWFGVEKAHGVLYFVSLTTRPDTITVNSMSVIALRIADGRQLWRSTVTQGGAVLLDSMLTNGIFYVAYDHSDGTPRGILYDTTIAAVQTSDGALRWQNHFNHLLAYTTLTASPDGRPALAHDVTVAELDAENGSNHWQRSVNVQEDEVFLSLIQAGGKLVEAYQGFHSTTPASIGTAHLCVLEPATGQTLWCQDFLTQVWVVEPGP